SEDGRQLQFEGRVPIAEGRVVVRAVERRMRTLPVMADGEQGSLEQRRADALVAICSAKVAKDPDPDRAAVVVHVPVEVLWGEEIRSRPSRELGAAGGRSRNSDDADQSCALEGGGVISVDAARRLACDA